MSNELMYNAAAASFGVAYMLIVFAWLVVALVGMWKLYMKAGKPGWASIVPFYNLYCLYEMAFGNGWLFLLTFVPLVNVVISIVMCFKLAKAFGQGIGFGFGLLFLTPIFMLILGFGGAEYIGPN